MEYERRGLFEVPPWESEDPSWWHSVVGVLARPRRTFSRLSDGDVGSAWTFAAMCCALPRLLYGVVDPRGGPMFNLLRAFLGATTQAACATFFLGALHYLLVVIAARELSSFRVSLRASAYAQAITMVVGVLACCAMLSMPALRGSALLRDGALLAAGTWYALPLYWVGRGRLQLTSLSAALCALAAPAVLLVALRALI